MPNYQSQYRIKASSVEIHGLPGSASVHISGTLDVDYTLNAPDITGSLYGTASWARNAITASHVLGSIVSASYALSASYAQTSTNALSSSYALTASYVSGSSISASYALSASYVLSASYAPTVPAIPLNSVQYNNGGVMGGSLYFLYDPVQETLVNGDLCAAWGNFSHAEGQLTSASAGYSHVEGYRTRTDVLAVYSHAEGHEALAIGQFSHAEGFHTTASANYSHAEGGRTDSRGEYSHAEGSGSIASGSYSHAEGVETIAMGYGQVTLGKYNQPDSTSLVIIGNGTSGGSRSNLVLFTSDSVVISGSTVSTGGFTGSLQGTASWANNVVSASYAATASLLLGSVISASYALSSSLATSASWAATASYYYGLGSSVSCSYTSSIANSTTTLATLTGTTMSLAAGIWNVGYRVGYSASVTTIGAHFTISGSVDIDSIYGSAVYTAGSGDNGTSVIGRLGDGLAVASSRATTFNGAVIQAIVKTLTDTDLYLAFRSEVGGNAITVTYTNGLAVKIGY